MSFILYFLYFIFSICLAIIVLPEPYDSTLGVSMFVIVCFTIPILFRLFKYLILMLKAKHLLKKNDYKLTKFCYFPFPSKLRGRYNMTLKNKEQTINIIFISKKFNYKCYNFESVDLITFFRYNHVMLYKGNGAGRTGSIVSKTNLVQRKNLGKQVLLWPPNLNEENVINVVLFDKWPERIFDSTKRDKIDVSPGDYICKSKVRAYDWKSFVTFIKSL